MQSPKKAGSPCAELEPLRALMETHGPAPTEPQLLAERETLRVGSNTILSTFTARQDALLAWHAGSGPRPDALPDFDELVALMDTLDQWQRRADAFRERTGYVAPGLFQIPSLEGGILARMLPPEEDNG